MLKLTILGCGSSGGVPRIGNNWGACDPGNPRNMRRRCSLLIEREGDDGTTTVLIDTSPDMRAQLIDAGVGWLDAVLFTHEHADHTHGIDDLRMVALNGRQRIRAYMSPETAELLMTRFAYCFTTPEGSPYPPILQQHTLYPLKPVTVDGKGGPITVLPFEQEHGHIRSLGFRVGNVAYSADVSNLSDASVWVLGDLDMWIVDALRYTHHPSHFSVEDALRWIERVKPRQAVLTNMHVDLDYETLRNELPAHVAPAYDMMRMHTVAALPERLLRR